MPALHITLAAILISDRILHALADTTAHHTQCRHTSTSSLVLHSRHIYLGGTCGTPSAGQCVQAPPNPETESWRALSSWGRGGSPATPSARPPPAQSQFRRRIQYPPAWSKAIPDSHLDYPSRSLPPAQRGGWGG